MSNYRADAFNPKTGIVEEANWLDNHFGRNIYGVKFDDSEEIFRESECGVLAIRAELTRLQQSKASIPTCAVTGAIPGDGGACGDCDPCIGGERLVPEGVKRLIAEKNSVLDQVCDLQEEIATLQQANAALRSSVEKEIDNIKDYERYGAISHAVSHEIVRRLGRALDANPSSPRSRHSAQREKIMPVYHLTFQYKSNERPWSGIHEARGIETDEAAMKGARYFTNKIGDAYQITLYKNGAVLKF